MVRKITVNGREYSSIEEMPPDVRKTYEEALASLTSETEPEVSSDSGPVRANVRVTRRYKINGREYASLDEVPPELRSAIEAAMTGREAQTARCASQPLGSAGAGPGEFDAEAIKSGAVPGAFQRARSPSPGGGRRLLLAIVIGAILALWLIALALRHGIGR